MPYHPDTSVIQPLAVVQRTRTLPPNAITDGAQVVNNEPVTAVQTVLAGDMLGKYHILDIVPELKLKDPGEEDIARALLVEAGMRVQFGQELARKGQGRRARTVLSPLDGVVVAIDGSRITLQERQQNVEIKSKIQGRVLETGPHQVIVSGNGALIQCAWGNGQFAYRAFKFLPADGFAALSKMDKRISEYREVVIISPEPINEGDLDVAKQQEVGGLVAPGMSSRMRQLALDAPFPVLLTEGFGQRRPTELIYSLLKDNMGLQATFDAAIPDRWNADRPEIMIPLPARGQTPLPPAIDQQIRPNMQVRITRAPWDGMVGKVEKLPQASQVIDNGLRVPCASVRLAPDRVVLVPLANLELLG